jgi:MFS family permease
MFVSLEQLGRRWTVIISDAVFTVGAVLCTVATNQLGLVYAGRLLTGLGVGGIAAVCPIYIAEISPPAIRGRLTGFFESSYQIGAVIGFWINYGIVHNINSSSSTAWRIPMGVQLIPAGLLALGIPFLRESPTWLLKKGRREQAYNVLSYYRALPAHYAYIAQDVAHIQSQIEGE